MLKIKRILFPTDYSEGAAVAFPQAAFLADAHDAELTILSVAGRHLHSYHEMLERHPLSEDELRDMVGESRIDVTKLQIKQEQVEGAVVPERIVEQATESDQDLIVMGTHGRSGVNRLLMGSVAEDVVRAAPCPVLTIRRESDRSLPATVRRILVPVDFSDGSRLGVAHALELALTYGAQIYLLHVVEEVVYPSTYGIEPVELPTDEVVENVESGLARIAREDIGVEHVVVEARTGYPPTVIESYAEEQDIDLIVLSTQGRTGLDRFLMGSVTEHVVRRAPQPVFIVRPGAKMLVDPENVPELA